MESAATEFVVMKSYDGGKHWEQERRCDDFASAAGLAESLRSQHPPIRFRVEAEAGRGARKRRR